MKFDELKVLSLQELRKLAKELDIKSITKYRKGELIEEILKKDEEKQKGKGKTDIVDEVDKIDENEVENEDEAHENGSDDKIELLDINEGKR